MVRTKQLLMEKLAIRTTNADLAEQVYDHLKERGQATTSFYANKIGQYQCNNQSWGSDNVGNWIESNNYTEITDEEYIKKYIQQETLQEKKERLEKELKEINEQLDIKVGDIIKRIKGDFANMNIGDFATVIRTTKTGIILEEYPESDGGNHDKNNFVKATPEEAKGFIKSKKEKEIQLSSGYILKMTKQGFTDQEGYLYTPEELKQVIESTEIGTNGVSERNVNIISATYQIGCQQVTLGEIKAGLDSYEKMFGKE